MSPRNLHKSRRHKARYFSDRNFETLIAVRFKRLKKWQLLIRARGIFSRQLNNFFIAFKEKQWETKIKEAGKAENEKV